MRSKGRGVVAVGLLLALVVGSSAAGATTVGTDLVIAAKKQRSDSSPDLVWNQRDNEYLAVWGGKQYPGAPQIYARRVGADGLPKSGALRIGGRKSWEEASLPAVAWNQTDNQYLVVWQDNRNWGTRRWDIYGRVLGADGIPLTGQFRINRGGNTWTDEKAPAVAWSPTANHYLVVWEDPRNSGTRGWDIYGQLVTPGGALLGSNFRVSQGGTGQQHELQPAVAWNHPAKNFVVVWQDSRDTGWVLTWSIFGRRVGTGGAPVGKDYRVSGKDADEKAPALACRRTVDECLVVWEDTRNVTKRNSDIYGRRIRADGTARSGQLRICGNKATATDQRPAVAWNQAAGQYLVVWTDYRKGMHIFGRRVAGGGGPLGTDFRVSGSRAVSADWPAVAWNQKADQYLVAWKDERAYWTHGSIRIYGKRVAGAG
ncbi:MAG: hypothetical protein FJW79_10495 [Actinobacteria bacterium]|nr:hypothetical protein [Actinomycetota bacterium]